MDAKDHAILSAVEKGHSVYYIDNDEIGIAYPCGCVDRLSSPQKPGSWLEQCEMCKMAGYKTYKQQGF